MNTRVRSFNHLALLLLSDASRSETSLIVYGSEIFYRSVTFLPNHVFPAGAMEGLQSGGFIDSALHADLLWSRHDYEFL